MEFYRYEAVQYASMIDDDYGGRSILSKFPNPNLELRVFNLFKETPKGYWIGYGSLNGLHSPKRWVSKTATKRFAYPSKSEALTNFIKRNERRISILSYQVQSCKAALLQANKLVGVV